MTADSALTARIGVEMDRLSADRLIEGCGDGSFDAGIRTTTLFEPLSGPGSPVKPAVYSGSVFQIDRRWWTPHGSSGTEQRQVDVVVIDNIPSQANRLEAALLGIREQVRLPELVLDLSELTLPAHLPASVSSFLFPHRNADAYLRDSALDGKNFMATAAGAAIFAASADNPDALFEWLPQALLFGFWQSHLGKKGAQTKLARSWVSEIVGYVPASIETSVLGSKGDPLNLSIDEAVVFNEVDTTTWKLSGAAKTGAKGDLKEKEKLSEIGHGQVIHPKSGGHTPAAVSFAEIVQQATVSFASLRRIKAPAEGRALLAAIGIAAHVAAFGRACSLRSGCELRPISATWTWLGSSADTPIEVPSIDDAIALVNACAVAAEKTGLPVGSKWSGPVVLTPQKRLADVIRKSWPEGEPVKPELGM